MNAALLSLALLHAPHALADPEPGQGARGPQRGAGTADGGAEQDEIQFRLLAETDFLAIHPPPETAGHPAGFNAVSCLRIGWRGLRFDFSTRGGGLSEAAVSATVTSPRFVALFDRKCSWWSAEPQDPDYALVHEQVHFAIAEHAARVLSQEMRAKKRVVRGYGPTRDRAAADLEESLRSFASQAKWAARREHDAFDAETSRDRSRSVQQKWVRLYEERLGVALSPRAR